MKIVLIIISVLLGAVGQIFFKSAMKGAGRLSLFEAAVVSLFSFYFWAGLFCYGISLLLWMKILSDTDLTYARPFAATGYILTAFLAWVVLGENISTMRWTGIIFICAGVFLVSKT